MSTLPRVGDLDLDQDLEFQRRSWRVQRIGWVVLLVILLAALLGLFGRGPLSRSTLQDPSGILRVEYDRFARLSTNTVLQITAQPAAIQEGRLQLWLDRDYLQGMKVEQVTPAPTQVESGAGRLLYTFSVADATQPVMIEFHLIPQQSGILAGQVDVSTSQAVVFRHFVYP